MNFLRFGSTVQAEINTFSDLTQAVLLHEALWMITACPTVGLACDPRFLGYLDTDQNKRIRVGEVREAVSWCQKQLSNHQGFSSSPSQLGSSTLTLKHLSAEAAKIHETALMILESLGAEDRTQVSLEQIRASSESLRKRNYNGDGILSREGVPPVLHPALDAMIGVLPTTPNRALQPGIPLGALQSLHAAIPDFQAHQARKSAVMIWGEQSPSLAERLVGLADRIHDYFYRCQLLLVQPDILGALRVGATQLERAQSLASVVSALPLAPPDPSRVLDFSTLYPGPERVSLQEIGAALGIGGLSAESWARLFGAAQAILHWQAIQSQPQFQVLTQVSEDQLVRLIALSETDLARKDELE